jgi:ABC-type transport system involved in multi-copper enzyme maturation permease subunit
MSTSNAPTTAAGTPRQAMNGGHGSGPTAGAQRVPGAASRPMPSLLSSSLRVFDLSLARMLWSRSTIFMALIVGLPIVIALIVRGLEASGLGSARVDGVGITGPALFGSMIWLMFLRFIVPVLAVFYGTSLIADEVEEKTITYLFTRPIARGAVMAGKYMAYLACTIMVVLPSVMIVYFLIVPFGGGSIAATFPDLVKDLALLALGLIAYGALFAWVGARFKRPLLTGLFFIFGWEQAALVFPGYLKRFTVAYYLQALVPHTMPSDNVLGMLQSIVRETPSLASCLLWLTIITALFLGLAIRLVGRREYVLEQ